MDDLFGLNDNPIERFTNRFGMVHGHLEMAYHAALPFALTPDLLYLIWSNFRSDVHGKPLNMQWVTVADLILSPLCREIRYETYVIETAVRTELLNRMVKDERFGLEYIFRLGRFVRHYARQYIQSDIPSLRQFAQVQAWAVQAYTEPDRLLENLSEEYSQGPDKAETVRLAELLSFFSEALNLDWVPKKADTLINFDRLQTFGDGLVKFEHGDQIGAIRQLRRLLGPSRGLHIGSIPVLVRPEVAQLLSQQQGKIFTYRIKVEDENTVVVEHINSDGTTLSIKMGQLALPEENIEIEVPESFGIDRKELELRLIENFSREEVNELISDLGLEQDQFLTFRTKSSLIRDLIRYFHRRDALDKLLQACHRSKPSVDWTDITDIVENYAPTSAIMFSEMLNNVESGHGNLDQLRSLGKQLFNILFDDTLRVDFLTFVEKAINESTFVRIELEIDNNFLQDVALLPWELLSLPEGTSFGTDWLAVAPELMINRLPSETITRTHFLPSSEPVRIALIIGPHARDDSPLLHSKVWEAYQTLVNQYPNDFNLLPLLVEPTYEQFSRLMSEQPHVVHLVIHAKEFDGTGEIALTPASDRARQNFNNLWMDGNTLAAELNQYDPTLVILQSDELAQPLMLRGLQDVAAVLVEKHTPSVVSWQFPIECKTVATFIHAVFPAFAYGIPLDEAMQNGRRVLLRDKNPLAFAAPSFFSNAIIRRHILREFPPTLPVSLGIAFAGDEITILLNQGEPLPAVAEPITMVRTKKKHSAELGYLVVQIYIVAPDNISEYSLLGEVIIDDESLYSKNIVLEVTATVDIDEMVNLQLSHASGFSRELSISLTTKQWSRPQSFDFSKSVLDQPESKMPVSPKKTEGLQADHAIVINRMGIELEPYVKQILVIMFAAYSQVIVKSEIQSGFSGSRVFLVRPVRQDGAELPAVIKIDHTARIQREWQAYQVCIQNRLPNIAEIRGEPVYPPGSLWGGLWYPMVGAGPFEIESLSQYLQHASLEDIRHTLETRLFKSLGVLWSQTQAVQPDLHLQTYYDSFLPMNLVIELTNLPPDAHVHWLDPVNAGSVKLQNGDYVQLSGFQVVEVIQETKKLSLDMPSGELAAYRVQVFPIPDSMTYEVGDLVQRPFTGIVRQTREELLREQVWTALGKEVDLTAVSLTLPNKTTLPNPLHVLPTLLNHSFDARVAYIHGDLNLENVLVETESRTAYLIDFAQSRKDHSLRDLFHLEMSVVTQLLSAALRENSLAPEAVCSFYEQLHCAVLHPGQIPAPAGLEKPFVILLMIRQAAQRYLFTQGDWSEYFYGLSLYLLGSLRYPNLDEVPGAKAVAFWGTAVTLKLLQSDPPCQPQQVQGSLTGWQESSKPRTQTSFYGPVTGPIHTGSGHINISPQAKPRYEDIFSAYENGLNRMLAQLGAAHSRYGEALVYQQRLTENISRTRRFGDTNLRQADRAEIIDQLNELVLATLGISFNRLCQEAAKD